MCLKSHNLFFQSEIHACKIATKFKKLSVKITSYHRTRKTQSFPLKSILFFLLFSATSKLRQTKQKNHRYTTARTFLLQASFLCSNSHCIHSSILFANPPTNKQTTFCAKQQLCLFRNTSTLTRNSLTYAIKFLHEFAFGQTFHTFTTL